jgi:UDP-N-acetylmuramoylalanine--D-glutamate ligase
MKVATLTSRLGLSRKSRRAPWHALAMGGENAAGAEASGKRPEIPVASETGARTRLIVGLGATGESVARFLAHRELPFAVTDNRDHPPGESVAENVPHRYGRFESPLPFAETLEAVVSPGVASSEPFLRGLRAHGVPLVSDIELFARNVNRPVIAVTGTNGKSTVVSLLAAMARAAGRRVALGGNLGTPALDLLGTDVDMYVLELSSFQLERTRTLAPEAAVVLNVSADHLDRHASVAAYAAAKARIYAHARHAIVNREDSRVMAMAGDREGALSFGLDVPGPGHYGVREFEGEPWLCRGDEKLMASGEVPLAGRHNLANVLAAWALGAQAGLDDADMAAAVRAFRPLAHRLVPVGEHAGVRYLDDSKATNVGAACATLESLTEPLVVIAGGEGKGQDFAPFAEVLANRARAVVLIGKAAGSIAEALRERLPVTFASGLSDAVGVATALARHGDAIVLAPACASHDMFSDYKARGNAFARAVEALNGD